jgi:urease accessory protein UreF
MEFSNAISHYIFSSSKDLATICLEMSEGMHALMSFDKHIRRLLQQQMNCVSTAVLGNKTRSSDMTAKQSVTRHLLHKSLGSSIPQAIKISPVSKALKQKIITQTEHVIYTKKRANPTMFSLYLCRILGSPLQ